MKQLLATILSVGTLLFLNGCKSDNQNQQFIGIDAMDSTVKPGDNFYMYANGKWYKTAVIPETESGIGSFLDLRNKTRANLRAILDEVSKGGFKEGTLEQKVGDFYASSMDSATIEKLGYEPVKQFLADIETITDAKGIINFVASCQTQNSPLLFFPFIGADEKNSKLNLPSFYQGGLGLPDRDYYFKNDAATVAVIEAYKKYLQTLFKLTGSDEATALKNTETIYNFEKQLASSHLTNVELRNPQINYNKMAVADLEKSMPEIGWGNLLSGMKIKTDSINIAQPKYFTQLSKTLKSVPLATWKLYLKAHILNDAAPLLSSDFVNAEFEYTGKALSGQQKLKPRWERMSMMTDAALGEALGQLYVKKHFNDDAKKRMLDLVNNLQKAFETRIKNLDWMSDSTKQKAIAKLNTFIKKIGFPDKWKDYSKVTIARDKFFANAVACSKNEYDIQVSKVGKPVDRTEWGMTPPTINAYYNPTFNEIVFPAGILQFPFFDMNADDAINYGGIGMVIGHEMTHGFDDQGAQYDKDGNLQNWWGKDDEVKFKAKAQQVIELYNGFTVLDSVHVNGALTTGENMADIGGVAIAYDAFKLTKQGQGDEKIDGFTPDQRFFLSVAQIWKSKQKEALMRQRINTDPHSPAIWRVLGPLMNFTPFYNAFGVKEGDKMWKPEKERIKIW